MTVNETNLRGRTTADIVALRALFVDFDDVEREPALRPSIIVNSLRGKHFYWLLDGTDPLDRFTAAQEHLAAFYLSDPKVKDLPRVMRLPGTRNHKRWDGDPLHGMPVTLSYVEEERYLYTIDDVLREHPLTAQLTKKTAFATPIDASRRVKEGEGRDNLLTSIAGTMRRRGISEEGILAALTVENAKVCDPPLEERDLIRISRSIARKEPADVPQLRNERQLSDKGNAEYFVALYGNEIRYSHEMKKWLVWDGRKWALDRTADVERKTKAFVDVLIKEASNERDETRKKLLLSHALRSQQVQRIEAITKLARSEDGVAVVSEAFDTQQWLINCRNGVVDLETGVLLQHDRSLLMTKMVEASLDENATCPLFDSFLERILPDQELREYVLRALGSSLNEAISDQIIFMPYGTGANGKSTLIELVQKILDGYARTANNSALLARRNDDGSTGGEIAVLEGARFVSAVETSEERHLNEEAVKRLTGGDTVSVRRLYEDFRDMAPGFKLWLATNHRPAIKSSGEAIWRRLHVIPFTVTIPGPERDQDLKTKLLVEADGIFTKLVAYAIRWRNKGLQPPQAVLLEAQAYREEEDQLAEFLDNNAFVDLNTNDLTWNRAEAYKNYFSFAEANREMPMSKKAFGLRMIEKGFGSSSRDARTRMARKLWFGVSPRMAGDVKIGAESEPAKLSTEQISMLDGA